MASILIVDDDPTVGMTFARMLEGEGHSVTRVETAVDGFSHLEVTAPDAVILDINLPDLSGWEVARRIRDRRGPQPLLIGISGEYKKGADKVLAHISGFDHYLVKPYDPKMIFAALDELRTGQR